MGRYVIERTLPGAGSLSEQELAAVAKQSNDVLAELGPDVSWDHSYVTDDKLYCVYDATDPALSSVPGDPSVPVRIAVPNRSSTALP